MLKIRRPLGRLIFNMGIAIPGKTVFLIETAPWLLFQFPMIQLIVKSRKVWKPRELYLKLFTKSVIWQAPQMWLACQISKWCDNSKYQSRGLETSRNLAIRCLIGYLHIAQTAVLTHWSPNKMADIYRHFQVHSSELNFISDSNCRRMS